jgi:hypothetical protein
MPSPVFLAAALLLADVPQVDVRLFSGEPRIERAAGGGSFAQIVRSQQSGRWRELTADVMRVETAPGCVAEIPLREVEHLQLTRAADRAETADPAAWLHLADGTVLAVGACEVSSRNVRVTSPHLGEFALPRGQLAAVRFQTADGPLAAAWSGTLSKDRQRDALVVSKREGSLDSLEGTAAGIDAETVRFLVDGEPVAVPRGKVFAVVFARTEPPAEPPRATVRFADGSAVQFRALAFDGTNLAGELTGATRVAVALTDIESIDFGGENAAWLSALKPRQVEFTPLFDDAAERSLFQFRADRNLEGRPLRLGGSAFRRGLWIHSKTRLVYRLGGDYRRLQAVAGIDDAVAQRGHGDVHATITARKAGDQTAVLWEADVRAADKPRILDLDVTDAIELEILVDFGGALNNIGDHFVLADAKLLR